MLRSLNNEPVPDNGQPYNGIKMNSQEGKKQKPKPSMSNPVDARIGIALGSGSARGWAHIGVLRALADMGVRPGIVAGTSIGALVGAAYAGNQLDAMEHWVSRLTWKDILTFMDFSFLDGRALRGEKIMGFVRQHLECNDIQSLPLPFGAVATELNTGREVWLRKGDILDSVRASIALPGLFAPFKLDGKWLVDGGLVAPVPIALCRAMGAEVVIAVNLNGNIVGKHNKGRENDKYPQKSSTTGEYSDTWSRISKQIAAGLTEQKEAVLSQFLGESRNTPGLFDVMASAINIMQDRITRSRMAGDPPDVLLAPRLSHLGLLEFDQAAVAMAEGRACVERMRPVLDQMLLEL